MGEFPAVGEVANFEGKGKSRQRIGVISRAQFFKTKAGIPSGPVALDVSRFSRIVLWLNTIGGMVKLVFGKEGGHFPSVSIVELEEKKWANRSAFSLGVVAKDPSSLERGGKELVPKLRPIDLANDQNDLLPLGHKVSLLQIFLLKAFFD